MKLEPCKSLIITFSHKLHWIGKFTWENFQAIYTKQSLCLCLVNNTLWLWYLKLYDWIHYWCFQTKICFLSAQTQPTIMMAFFSMICVFQMWCVFSPLPHNLCLQLASNAFTLSFQQHKRPRQSSIHFWDRLISLILKEYCREHNVWY